MTVDRWIRDRETDNFIIDYDGETIYDARKTKYEPKPFVMESVIQDIYEWNGVVVLEI